jgi:hypothetical protein
MIINKFVVFTLGILLVFGLFGCVKQVHVEPDQPICLSAASRTQLMDICEDVLVTMQFEIEKFDVDKGYIKTRPLRGGQFFEFWRSDNAGSTNFSDSNMHSVLRTTELQITPDADGFCVDCTVLRRRLSIKESELTSSSINTGIFTGGSRTFQKLRPIQKDLDWIEMPADTKLQQRILGRILGSSAQGGQ